MRTEGKTKAVRTEPKAARLRSRTPKDASHSERQRRYRAKLQSKKEPEPDDVDNAIVLVMRRWCTEAVKALRDELAASKAAGRKGELSFQSRYVKALADGLMRGVVDELVSRGYKRAAAEKRLRWRLIPEFDKDKAKASKKLGSPPA